MFEPPSIRMRRKPRSASAARMAAGASCPSVRGEPAPPRRRRQGRAPCPCRVITSLRTPSSASSARGRRKPAVRIDHHARRVRTGDAADGQLRIVGQRGADADDDGIDQRAQAMQMGEPFGAVDVVRVSAGGGDAGVDRLAALRRRPPCRRPCRGAADRKSPARAAGIKNPIPEASAELRPTYQGYHPWPCRGFPALGFFRTVAIVS